MKKLLKKIKNLIFGISSDLEMIEKSLSSKSKVNYKKYEFSFINTNDLLKYRIKNFLTKEPDTIKWIEEFDNGSSFWILEPISENIQFLPQKQNKLMFFLLNHHFLISRH